MARSGNSSIALPSSSPSSSVSFYSTSLIAKSNSVGENKSRNSRHPSPNDFNSYEELKHYTVGLIEEIGLCFSLKQKHPDAFVYFYELFQRHPDGERKKVSMIEDITINRFPKVPRNRPMTVRDYQIFIQTSNGCVDSISWVKSMRREDYSIEKKLTSAMRHSIEDQIRSFRRSQPSVCLSCGASTNLSVHHVNHFEALSYDFLHLYPNHPAEFADDHITSQDTFRLQDNAYKKLWQDYHRKEAILEILCVPCNEAQPAWVCPVERKEKRWRPKKGAWT
eukprot:CAMPEP_0194216238 /NCGR_PEP_ID=MMETSP0156-20130528/18600_1 /TAXON_ID=33649 /ORGANISM="Thalassionema nitzschioides, Strain L26-B" /LENGTH=278 /DNA_ID=CAMNT_0038944957 /DNA_START=117 /DNA_END=954 /DNA_ORIENTATION=+